ncbi:hypothetical protein ZOSMA_249G00040 [Zostera marina]|uniref:Uncharacterized protein n=1 Tax=Zostera marina TaxID=29655 RepID=A0A0K9PGH3_ZOSMR|nr:hypothetical protein ZOSMA_249G00040 [Zostera marina]
MKSSIETQKPEFTRLVWFSSLFMTEAFRASNVAETNMIMDIIFTIYKNNMFLRGWHSIMHSEEQRKSKSET